MDGYEPPCLSLAAPPVFTTTDKPRDILNAAGRWLALELGGGFRWVPSARTLKMEIAPGRTGEVQLRPSHWNYTGLLTHALIQVTVRDQKLARWRRQRGRNFSGLIVAQSPDAVWGMQMINIDRDLRDVELFGDVAAVTGSSNRYLTLPELLVAVQTRILPKLLMFESPARAARDLPDIWLAEPDQMVEWANSLGDEESARLIATRAERLKRTAPPESELEVVLAAGRELLETLRSELRHFRELRDLDVSDELVEQGLTLTYRWTLELSDPQGRTDRVPEGALRDWAAHNLPVASPIRAKAIAFDAAAAQLRRRA